MVDHDKVNILIIEDDIAQYTILKAYMETQSFNVTNIGRIKEFEDIIKKQSINIIILDLNLPDGDGLVLVQRICDELKIPLIIVSSRHTSMDRIMGLELGADDYITKPYNLKELLIRVKKLLKRYNFTDYNSNKEIFLGDFRLDEEKKCLYDKSNQHIVSLTFGEYSIITALIKANGKVISRSQLIEVAFSRIEYPTDRSIDVLISRIRKKTKTTDSEIIQTVRGFGYRINKA